MKSIKKNLKLSVNKLDKDPFYLIIAVMKMFTVAVTHKIAWTRWLRANTKGYWRVCFNTDEPDNYFFEHEDDAKGFESHVAQRVWFVNSRS